MSGQDFNVTASVNSNQNQKVVFKVGTFYNNQHKLSRAFQTDMHNKLHKGHSTELVKIGGGIKKRIFSLFVYMHHAHYVYFCVHHVFVK
jgi:hypothetical protein